MISSPLRLFDFCLETDGACAVVVTSADRAKDWTKPTALIRAVAQGSVVARSPASSSRSCCARIAHDTAGQADGRHPLSPSRPRTRRHRRRPDLRLLHDHRPAAARGLRVLRQGRRRRVRVERRDRARWQPADQHRRRPPVRGLHPRHEPHRRRRPPDQRRVHVPGPRRRDLPRHLRRRSHPAAHSSCGGSHDRQPRPRPCSQSTTTATRPASSRRPGAASWSCGRATDAAPSSTFPVAYCRTCGSFDGRWQVVSGTGTTALVDGGRAPGPPGLPGALHHRPRRARRSRPACATSGASPAAPTSSTARRCGCASTPSTTESCCRSGNRPDAVGRDQPQPTNPEERP